MGSMEGGGKTSEVEESVTKTSSKEINKGQSALKNPDEEEKDEGEKKEGEEHKEGEDHKEEGEKKRRRREKKLRRVKEKLNRKKQHLVPQLAVQEHLLPLRKKVTVMVVMENMFK